MYVIYTKKVVEVSVNMGGNILRFYDTKIVLRH